MGVTIHFEGKLKDNECIDKVIQTSRDFAVENNMDFDIFEEPNKLLLRVRNEVDCNYQGLTRGIFIQPDVNTDPLWIEFDEDNYIQEYCKTQFANKYIHVKIVKLLKSIESYFQNLIVTDEGEYWDTGDSDTLQEHIDNCFDVIEKLKKENPKLSGPYRVEDNRIVDLMEQD